MAYNEKLADRVREALETTPKVIEKQMFGGVCFMVNGKMCVGIVKDELMCRINPDIMEDALAEVGCRPMDFSGKPMRGFIYVNESGLNGKGLTRWINLSLTFNKLAKPSKKKALKKRIVAKKK